MLFSNYREVATSLARKKLLRMINSAIIGVQPRNFMPRYLKLRFGALYVRGKKINILHRRVFVVGAGKAAAEMASQLEKILGVEKISDGIVVSNKNAVKLNKIKLCVADHPFPSTRGRRAAEKIFDLKKKHKINKNDLVIELVSGGGSALLPLPVSGIPFRDKQKMYELFLKKGVPGRESTIIKTKISRVKGGGLARHFAPAEIISLVLSDDNGASGDEFTASGPSVVHRSTFADALRIIDKYKMRQEVPRSIISFLERNRGKDTRKDDLKNVRQFVLGSNNILLNYLAKLAKRGGLTSRIRRNMSGEAGKVARDFCREIIKRKTGEPILLLFGGETTVSLPSRHGLGGRNQEFVSTALDCLKEEKFFRPWALAAVATDGIDFIPTSAGGIIDHSLMREIKDRKILIDDFIEEHNSHRLLKMINSNLVCKEATGTNVGDVVAYLQL